MRLQRLQRLFQRIKNAVCKRVLYPVAKYQCSYQALSLNELSPKSAVIYIPDKIGDAMSVFPLIRALDAYGLDALIIVASHNNQSVFENVNTCHMNISVIVMPIHIEASCSEMYRIAREIKGYVNTPDLFFDAIRFDKYKTLLLIGALKSRINYKVGALDDLPCFSNTCINATNLHAHNSPIMQVWERLLKDSGFPAQEAVFEFPIDQRVLEMVEPKLPEKRKYIALNLDSSLERKSINLDKARELVRLIYNSFDLPIIAMSSPSGQEKVRVLEKEFDYVHILPIPPSLDCSATIVKDACLLVTPDTSILHMAGAFDTPVIAIYALNHNNSMWPPTSAIAERIQVNGAASSINLDLFVEALENIKVQLNQV